MTHTDSLPRAGAAVVPFLQRPEIDVRMLVTSTVTVVEALDNWTSWALDFPPTGATLGPICDKLLADEFRALIALPNYVARLEYLEGVIHGFQPARGNSQRVERFLGALIEWWLDIFAATQKTVEGEALDAFVQRYCAACGIRFYADTFALAFSGDGPWTAAEAAHRIEQFADIYSLRRRA